MPHLENPPTYLNALIKDERELRRLGTLFGTLFVAIDDDTK